MKISEVQTLFDQLTRPQQEKFLAANAFKVYLYSISNADADSRPEWGTPNWREADNEWCEKMYKKYGKKGDFSLPVADGYSTYLIQAINRREVTVFWLPNPDNYEVHGIVRNMRHSDFLNAIKQYESRKKLFQK